MIGGSSSPPPAPPPPDPRAEAQAQFELEQQLAEMRAQEAAAAEAQRQQQEQQRLAERSSAIDRGSLAASDRIGQELQSLYGVDPGQYQTDIDNEIARIVAGIPQSATAAAVDPFFAGDLTSPLVTRLEDRTRGQYNRALDQFAAPGFTQNLYTGTEDDAIIDSILSDQYGTATDILQRAFARGTLDETGHAAALNRLGEQRTAADSRLQSLGGGLLEGFRTGARGIADTARDRIGTLSLGQAFDPQSVQQAITDDRTTNLAGLEGDLRAALGSEPLFDTSTLIQRGGITQGLINPAAGGTGSGSELLAALRRRTTDEDRERGLGSQGVI